MRQLYDLLQYFMLLRYLMFCPKLSCTLIYISFDFFFLCLSLLFLFFLLELNFPNLTYCCYQLIAMIFIWYFFSTLYVLLRSDIILVFLLLVRVQFPIAFLLCSLLYMYLIIYTYRYIWLPIIILCYYYIQCNMSGAISHTLCVLWWHPHLQLPSWVYIHFLYFSIVLCEWDETKNKLELSSTSLQTKFVVGNKVYCPLQDSNPQSPDLSHMQRPSRE